MFRKWWWIYPKNHCWGRVDLYDSQIFDGNRDFNWGDIGTTYIVDKNNGVGGNIDWENKDSFLEKHFFQELLLIQLQVNTTTSL